MEFSSSDIPSMGCKKKCNDTCQCSSIAQLFGGLWDTSKGRNSALNSLDNKLASWGCKNSSCCAISSLYAASTFGFKIDELVYSTNVNAIYEALETITGIEQIDIEPNTLVVTIKGAAGILGSALNMLLGMGYSVSKIILDEKKPPKTTKMGEIEMEERGMDAKKKKTGKKGKKGKLISSSEDVPLLSSVVVDETEPDLKLHFKVGGMTCGSCVGMITHSVLSLPLVRSCDVNLLAQEMIVRFPSDVETSIVSKDVVSAVEDLGFTAEEMKKKLATKDPITTISLNISGMTCSSCVGMIENCLMNTKGVSIASVNLLSNLATVTFDETVTGARDLIESVSELGFGASLRSEHEQTDLKDSLTRKSEIESWRKKFFISLVFTLPIILITMVFMYIPGIKHLLHVNVFVPRLPLESVLSALLATPVQFYCCWEFYIKAWKSLKARAANMEVLVSMGSSVAYAYSLFSIIKHALDPKFAGHHFFETSAALICFVLLGRLLENIAKGKTSQALVRLMDLKPKTALLVKDFRSSSQLEEEIHSDLIQMGDILKVIPGSSVPADGTVVSGYSSVNESMITGEAASVFKEVGSQVVGGTINNEGLLFIKASRVGANSTLSQIVQLVEEAQTSKPPIQAFADKITGYFVPTVVCIAVVTWLVWFLLGIADAYPAEWRNGSDPFLFSLMFGISVLVISCPCALGLATPTAVMVGTGVGAKLGLLIKGGQPLEMAQKVNTFLFDKTGTLTVGNLQVTDFIVVNANGEEVDKASSQQKEFLLCLGSAESASEHPIGKAIVKYCKEILGTQLPSPIHFVTTAGKGLSCQVDDKKVVVGNRSFIQNCVRENQEEAKTIPTSLLTRADGLEEQGKTCIFVALDGVAAGLVALSDVLKPEARAVIKFLREQGNEIYMVTGDNHRVARHVGRQLGLEGEHVISEVIPKEKGDMVKLLQSKGKTVAFVGDGINDSVALSQADLGIALGSGTDVAMECADVVVMGTGLQGVGTAVELARTTYRRMRLNMLWALLYNSLAIPLAAGLFFPLTHSSLPPMFAGFAMAISSVSVVVSSLMLRLYKPRDFGVQDAN